MQEEFEFDSSIDEINETKIQVKGWYPVTIEYGIAPLGQSFDFQMCWRVQGTEHVFRIPLKVFYELSKDYEEHFTQVLETFRIDYLDWYKQGFREPWMQKYRAQFKNFIYTFE